MLLFILLCVLGSDVREVVLALATEQQGIVMVAIGITATGASTLLEIDTAAATAAGTAVVVEVGTIERFLHPHPTAAAEEEGAAAIAAETVVSTDPAEGVEIATAATAEGPTIETHCKVNVVMSLLSEI
jgi:hypothetical protein